MYKFLERAETKPTVGIVCPRDKIHTYVFRHCHSLLLSDTTHRGSSFIEREKNDSPFFFMSTRKRAWGKKGQQFPCKMMMISRDIHVNSGELCVRFFSLTSLTSLHFDLILWMTHHTYQMYIWLAYVTKPFQWLKKVFCVHFYLSANWIRNAIFVLFQNKCHSILYSSDVECINWMHCFFIEYA